MPGNRPHAAAVVIGIALLSAAALDTQADIGGQCTLNPKTYTSSSGEYELHVDPSTICGQGEGTYALRHKGVEIWQRTLPFTLWDAGVTDDGAVAGFAYSGGMDNDVPRGETGKLHIVILDPHGVPRLNDALPRRGIYTCTSTVDRYVEGFILDTENDRFILRVSESKSFDCPSETWRAYRLSTGAPLDEFQFAHPGASENEFWLVRSARAVAGTPLILVDWSFTRYGKSAGEQPKYGGCFHLIDPAGESVWELDLTHGSEDGEYESTLDERQQFAIDDFLREHGAILQWDQPRQFDIWLIRSGQRVTYTVQPDGAGAWRVAEQGRTDYHLPPAAEARKEATKLEALSLKHLGSINLRTAAAPLPEIRAIECFDIDDRGRIGFLRRESDCSMSFLLVQSDGNVLRTLSLREAIGVEYRFPAAAWLGGDRWVLIATVLRSVPGRERMDSATRAWWLDVDSGTLSPIDGFSGAGARHVAATHDGGFVVATSPESGGERYALVAFDPQGKERWRVATEDESRGVTVTTRGQIIARRTYSNGTFSITNLDGKALETRDCRDLFDKARGYAEFVTADSDGGLVVVFGSPAPRIMRIAADWTVRETLDPRYADGRPVEPACGSDETALRTDQNGTLWICDTHSFLRIHSDGTVARVLGEPPGAPELREVGGVTIDQHGTIYVADMRNGITHVFDSDGRATRLLRPNPDDFGRDGGSQIGVAGDGSIFVNRLEFSPSGERVGRRHLPDNVEEPDVFFGAILCQPPNRRYWVVSREAVTLIGDDNAILRTLRRRPDRNWLECITGSGVAPDGSLVLSAKASGAYSAFSAEGQTINMYAASGDAVKTIAVPELGDGDPLEGQLTFSGRYLVAGPCDYANPRYVLLDTRADPPKWYDLGKLVPGDDWWEGFVVRDGRELWMFAKDARKVERFSLPADTGRAASSAPIAADTQPPVEQNKYVATAPARREVPIATGAAIGSELKSLNQLAGVVVRKADGHPVANVSVVMAHAAHGSLDIGPGAALDAVAQPQLPSRAFVSRNAKLSCDAFTDERGAFVMRGFAAPGEVWNLAAGDREHGICLRTGIIPTDHADKPLRIEIDAPAFITVNRLPDPPKGSFQAAIEVAIAHTRGPETASLGGRVACGAPGTPIRISAWPENADDVVWRLGPFPADCAYRVAHVIWSPRLRYDVTLFERSVFLRPGSTEHLVLAAEPGMTIKGRLTDTANRPLADVNVLLRTQSAAGIVLGALSDDDGRYALDNVPAGTHILELLRHAKPTAPT